MRLLPFLSALLLAGFAATAQDRPIGYWRAHYSYTSASSVATDGQTLFVAGGPGFYTFNAVSGERTTYSKVEGMADVNTTRVGHDLATGTTIIGYENSNIDLFRNESFYSVPDLKNKSFSGDKSIHHIYTENGLAYLSTGLGIVVLNLEEQEVKETYTFSIAGQVFPIMAFQALGTYFYAATPRGLYRANKSNPNLQAFASWSRIGDSLSLRGLAATDNRLYVLGDTTLYLLNGSNLDPVYLSRSINHIDAGNGDLLISEYNTDNARGRVKHFSAASQMTDSFDCGFPLQALILSNSTEWVADDYIGLAKRKEGNLVDAITPTGPRYFTAFDIAANNREVLVAHGGYTDKSKPAGLLYGVSAFNNEFWRNYSIYSYAPFGDSVSDLTCVLKDARTGDIYTGSLQDGLYVIKADGGHEIFKQESPIEPANADFGSTLYPVLSLAQDLDGNIVVGQLQARNHEIALRTPEGTWHHYTTPYSFPSGGLAISAEGLTIDDYNQKWYFQPQGGGVFVYNDNHTPGNLSDDTYGRLLAGKGAGNLPDNRVFCLAKDKNNTIWVGTANGIAIVNCPELAPSGQCEAELRVVQYDQFPGYLFQNQQVRSIAVDGANRKWVGTGAGVWLISPDADKVVYRFTEENSPLPSNVIQKISIDPVTGDVYIGTDKGLVSFRSTATEGGETNEETAVTFPNPVPSGYSGTIGIRGLVANADVRITDIAGQLVYRTKALGGQAVWNGLDYTGRRPQSGVYLIFITNKDGSQTKVGKMLFME